MIPSFLDSRFEGSCIRVTRELGKVPEVRPPLYFLDWEKEQRWLRPVENGSEVKDQTSNLGKSSNCSSILRMKHHFSPTLVSASKLYITDVAGGWEASVWGVSFLEEHIY